MRVVASLMIIKLCRNRNSTTELGRGGENIIKKSFCQRPDSILHFLFFFDERTSAPTLINSTAVISFIFICQRTITELIDRDTIILFITCSAILYYCLMVIIIIHPTPPKIMTLDTWFAKFCESPNERYRIVHQSGI